MKSIYTGLVASSLFIILASCGNHSAGGGAATGFVHITLTNYTTQEVFPFVVADKGSSSVLHYRPSFNDKRSEADYMSPKYFDLSFPIQEKYFHNNPFSTLKIARVEGISEQAFREKPGFFYRNGSSASLYFPRIDLYKSLAPRPKQVMAPVTTNTGLINNPPNSKTYII
jgi:hypothetical protein